MEHGARSMAQGAWSRGQKSEVRGKKSEERRQGAWRMEYGAVVSILLRIQEPTPKG